MRELLRAKARAQMEKRGLCHVNKKRRGPGGQLRPSYFSQRWREYARM